MIGWAFRQIAVWAIGVALLFAVLGNFLGRQQPSTTVATAPAASKVADAPATAAAPAVPNSLVFRANKDGHVYLDAVVNGAPVRFVVDTGATTVVLTVRDAAAAGYSGGGLNFTARTNTANGIGRAAPVKLRELRLGQFSVEDVPALVIENVNISLLGQSFLTRLESYEMRDGVLTLNWN